MLVLSRKKGESIIIQDEIEVTILQVGTDSIKIGVKAPRHIEVLRKEICLEIKKTNAESAKHMELKQLKESFLSSEFF